MKWLWALFILTIIIVIFMLTRPREEALDIEGALQKSAGTFDGPARWALGKIDEKKKKRAEDFGARARIMRYNVNEGEVRGNEADRVAYNDYLIALSLLQDEVDNAAAAERIVDDARTFRPLAANFDFAPVDNKINKARLKEAARAETREEAAKIALTPAVRSDPQNVHDSAVGSGVVAILAGLKGRESDVEAKVAAFIDEEISDKNVADRALKTLNKMLEVGDVRLDKYADSEMGILARVWARTNHPSNAENAKMMKIAVIDALADAVENDIVVCVTGRVNGLVASIGFLDFAGEGRQLMTRDMAKNDIMREVMKALEGRLNEEEAAGDKGRVAASFRGKGEADEAAERAFFSQVKTDIDVIVDKHRASFGPAELEKVRRDCYIYATIEEL